MAILTIPFIGAHLVPHVGGGIILHAGGGFVANAMIPASVVEAFGVAAGVLGKMGTGVAAVGSAAASPYVLGAAALAVVTVGSYCYFHGIPAPIEAALSSAGLGVGSKQGFAVSTPQLAVALIALGGAGYVAYRFYKNFRAVRAARLLGSAPDVQSKEEAEATVRQTFGEDAWTNIGASVWSCVGDAGRAASTTAQQAINGSVALAQRLAAAAAHALDVAKDSMSVAATSTAEVAGSVGTSGQAAFKSAAVVGADVTTGVINTIKRIFSRGS